MGPEGYLGNISSWYEYKAIVGPERYVGNIKVTL